MTNDRRLRCSRCRVPAEFTAVDYTLERVRCPCCGVASGRSEVARILEEEASYTANRELQRRLLRAIECIGSTRLHLSRLRRPSGSFTTLR